VTRKDPKKKDDIIIDTKGSGKQLKAEKPKKER